ncbi:Protein of unknown function [Bacillus cytotoxicus]|nr:Protein of unknown function [Bacillus cytotoxicus]
MFRTEIRKMLECDWMMEYGMNGLPAAADLL